MAKIEVTLTLEKRLWTDFALETLAWMYGFASLVSEGLAQRIADAGVSFIAKRGFTIRAD